jgi:hypothetical protein
VVHESTGRENLEDLCNKANASKLQQTADTPFMTGSLQEDVEWVGIGPAVCMILDGTYDPPPRRWTSTLRSLLSSSGKIAKQLNMTPCIKSLQRNGSTSRKEQQSGRPVDVKYCILEHGNQDHSVRPLRNWMLYSQISHCKLDILRSDGL